MKGHPKVPGPMLAGLVLLASRFSLLALDPQDYAVQATVQTQVTPAQIALQWPRGAFATGYLVSRKLALDQSWNPLASLGGDATGFTDGSVVSGAAYEYEIAQSNSDGTWAYGYVYAGMGVPFPGTRGRVVLLVDATYSSALVAELATLQQDLVGDGWTVLRHDVDPASTPPAVKSIVLSDYQADPVNTKAVFLFGHVPVPYSGDINPDMHSNHIGAWPADVYYGELSGNWTDTTVNDTSAEDPRNHNVPGDGKFDQSDIPGPVLLQVGRVDFVNLPSFAPRTDVDLLRQYLNKDHNYRHGVVSLARRGLIRDNFGDINGDAPATDAWRTFAPFFGLGNIDVIGPGAFFSTLDAASYLFVYGGGGGEYYQADGVGSSSDFAAQSPQGAFYMLDGSYFGDWDSYDNLLRAALASPGLGLAAAETGLPHWFLHHMALGETIGFSTLVTQNNRQLYKNMVNLSAGQVHIALMGDPTLRLHVVAPPANLVAQPAGGSAVSLNWTPSNDSVEGYYLYRASDPAGPFARITRSFLTGNSYTDAAAPSGQNVYMVRAIKLETSASGTYFNPSQGIFATVGAGTGTGPGLPVVKVEAANPTAQETGFVEGDFVVTRAGPTDTALMVNFAVTGTAVNGVDYEELGSSVTLSAGNDTAWIPVKPLTDPAAQGDQTVVLTLSQSGDYQLGSSVSATVTIQDAAPVVVPDKIDSITRSASGSPAIRFNGTPAAAYSVQVSSDLVRWTTIGNGSFDSSGAAVYQDTQNPTNSVRFYRIQSGP